MGDFVFFRIFGILGLLGSVGGAGPQDRNPNNAKILDTQVASDFKSSLLAILKSLRFEFGSSCDSYTHF